MYGLITNSYLSRSLDGFINLLIYYSGVVIYQLWGCREWVGAGVGVGMVLLVGIPLIENQNKIQISR